MKKYLIGFMLVFAALFINACDSEDTNNPTDPGGSQTGNLYLTSDPSGAQIWIGGTNTGKVTPDTIKGLNAGSVTVTLKYPPLADTTFTATVTSGSTMNWTKVSFATSTKTFGLVRIWETIGTTAAQPSGLILSTGAASGVSSSAAERAKVDLFYNSTGFVVASADLYGSGLTRVTNFILGNDTTLTNGTDAPSQTTGWTKSFKDTENNYVFVKDADNHYSKIRIVNRGGGTPGNPAWVEVRWIYNQVAGDKRF